MQPTNHPTTTMMPISSQLLALPYHHLIKTIVLTIIIVLIIIPIKHFTTIIATPISIIT